MFVWSENNLCVCKYIYNENLVYLQSFPLLLCLQVAEELSVGGRGPPAELWYHMLGGGVVHIYPSSILALCVGSSGPWVAGVDWNIFWNGCSILVKSLHADTEKESLSFYHPQQYEKHLATSTWPRSYAKKSDYWHYASHLYIVKVEMSKIKSL